MLCIINTFGSSYCVCVFGLQDRVTNAPPEEEKVNNLETAALVQHQTNNLETAALVQHQTNNLETAALVQHQATDSTCRSDHKLQNKQISKSIFKNSVRYTPETTNRNIPYAPVDT